MKKQSSIINAQKEELEMQQKALDKLFKSCDEMHKEIANLSELSNKRADDILTRAKKANSTADFCKRFVDEQNRLAKHDYWLNLPDNLYVQELSDWFKRVMGETLELDNPITFNQKIQWLKLFDTTPEKTQLSDKYLVREWVKGKIGDKYLTKLYGVWDNFDDIDFDSLPDKFVLKANHGCAFNFIVPDKSEMDRSDARYKFASWLKFNYAFRGLEPQYCNIKPLIIAEEYLENDGKDLYDYKIWCFDGKPTYIQFIRERNHGGIKMAFFDTEWNKMPFVYNYPRIESDVEKPENLDEMLDIAKTLCEGFCYVCVDLYHLNDNSIKFGEMTFTRANGTCRWTPPEYNEIIGSMIKLPEKKPFIKEI